uniref:Dorsal gland cell-specific expression protein n=1 Tax=Heterodera avenae TaxID=34510 RepID=F8QV54_HETAV|nr:dorsal gland cell-specific expression protein [Heterodera avenae]
MSDHPKEADRDLKRIFICDDIYFDVFRLLSPAKVGLELALVSDRFDALVDTHFKSRKWTLGELDIYSENIDKTNYDGTEKELPFPQESLPNSIVGFSPVYIFCVNFDVISFLQCIGRLLASNVCLKFDINGEANWKRNLVATYVWSRLNMSAIIKIHFGHPTDLLNFRRHISPSILRDCSNLRVITFNHDKLLQFLPDDSTSDGAMCKWLHTPCADGQPKLLKFRKGGDFFPMGELKTAFLSATTSASFFILLRPVFSSVGPFELVNSLTCEHLTSRRIDNCDNWWLIARSPIDKSVQKWAEWEKKALEEGTKNDWKVLGILLD